MGILGEHSILRQMDCYIKENYMFEGYSIKPADEYNPESNISFVVVNSDDQIATIKILKTDGESVDAVGDNYDYDDVFADISLELEGKEDQYDVEAVKKWTLGKLSTMGYDKNPALIDGDEYDVTKYKDELDDEPDELDDVKGDVEEIDGSEFSLSDLEDEE